jgi:hypothetical protein
MAGRRGRARVRRTATPAPRSGWRVRHLGARGSRRRAWVGAGFFAVLAVVGLAGGDGSWRRTAVLLGVLAAAWAGRAAFTRY